MWGINPFVVGQILMTVALREIISGSNGAPKLIRDQILIHIASKEVELAKAMARSVANQDQDLYAKLKLELRDKLSDADFRMIFTD